MKGYIQGTLKYRRPNSSQITLGSRKKDDSLNDFYASPPFIIDYLLKEETFDKNVWECACGTGNLSKRLEDYGYNVLSTDLVDRGFGTGGVDFLECTENLRGILLQILLLILLINSYQKQ